MKKLLILTLLINFSCSTPDKSNRETVNCTCETIISANQYSLPNGHKWTVITWQNDCSNAQRQDQLDGYHYVGEKSCN